MTQEKLVTTFLIVSHAVLYNIKIIIQLQPRNDRFDWLKYRKLGNL
jgi:hypothetical protein